MTNARMKFFIRVTNVGIFNSLVKAAEEAAATHQTTFVARRSGGYYELLTASASLWRQLYLLGQMTAQAQDENIEGGELQTL